MRALQAAAAGLLLLVVAPLSRGADQDKRGPATAAMAAGGASPITSGEQGFAWPRAGAYYGRDGAPMVLVPAGPFTMGSGPMDKAAKPDEQPAHRVTLKAFYIDRFEVTQGQYRKFLAAVVRDRHRTCDRDEPAAKEHTPAVETWRDADPASGGLPVVGVDWFDAAAYCAWAGQRLETEAEWEKAARGTDERTYPWGSHWDRTRANSYESGRKAAEPIGSHESGAGPYGAEDMAGNVWEWVQDWYAPRYYLDGPKENPQGPATGSSRVVRGGSSLSDARGLRSAGRDSNDPAGRYENFGFRCAQDQGRP
jgi:formylglycine-generating enzyme required for sulfatase activity